MSLTLAYNIARNALAATGLEASVLSRNIGNANNPVASAKSVDRAMIDASGHARITNAVNEALLEHTLQSTSAAAQTQALSDGIDQLAAAQGDPQSASSPASLISKLENALQTAAGNPSSTSAAQSVVGAAGELTRSLSSLARATASVQQSSNAELANSAGQLSKLLDQFATVNTTIVSGEAKGADVTDAIDKRNGILLDISNLVDVKTLSRDNGDMTLFLPNGATLFEETSRGVSVEGGTPTGGAGPELYVDGLPILHSGDVGGKIGGLLDLRDKAAQLQAQTDELARGLIAATAETDQSASPSAPSRAGLFTWSGGPALPGANAVTPGLALSIKVNPNVDPQQGGDLARLRDGGIADPSNAVYKYNTTNAASFGGRLQALADSLGQPQAFNAVDGGLPQQTSVLQYAQNSAAWLQSIRSDTSSVLQDQTILSQTSLSAWQGQVGINSDEMTIKLIALEKSYQASSHLISTINSMFDTLLQATTPRG